ncbi:hypothetical protein T08_14992 [Trichinella sp. T8]|nr:hypothetical protein T08_14992 [Trichinella sp. T8]
MKPIPKIYTWEVCSASAKMEISGQFKTYRKLQTIMYSTWGKCPPLLPACDHCCKFLQTGVRQSDRKLQLWTTNGKASYA